MTSCALYHSVRDSQLQRSRTRAHKAPPDIPRVAGAPSSLVPREMRVVFMSHLDASYIMRSQVLDLACNKFKLEPAEHELKLKGGTAEQTDDPNRCFLRVFVTILACRGLMHRHSSMNVHR